MLIYFATDVHGSEVCFRKFLNSYSVYQPDVMIIGGDITGKVLVPIVDDGTGGVRAVTTTGDVALKQDDIAAYRRRIADMGSYTWMCHEDEYMSVRRDSGKVEAIFHRAISQRVEEWMVLAQERLGNSPVRVFISAGNDDHWYVDDVLRSATRIEWPDERVVSLQKGVEMLSLGVANETPWQCPRDVPEEMLRAQIDALARQLSGGATIFNIHVPPFDSKLDAGPKLDQDQRPRLGLGGMEQTPVGSHAVREAIADHAPLLSLHGHIHESRGIVQLGNTVAINPGSEYNQGLLRGALIEVKSGKIKRPQLTCG